MFSNLKSWQRDWILGAALMALVVVVYWPSFHGVFVWDDSFMITDNQSLRGWEGLKTLWFTNKFADPYRITMTSFWVEWQLWGLKPMGYHVVSVVTHGIGVILLWRVLLRLGAGRGSQSLLTSSPTGKDRKEATGKSEERRVKMTSKERAAAIPSHVAATETAQYPKAHLGCEDGRTPGLAGAWLAAAVFAVHPVGAASAAWISEQKNTWSLIFYLLTILWYLRFEASGRKWSYAFALFLYVCALMSKGSVVMLPVVLVMVIWWQRGGLGRILVSVPSKEGASSPQPSPPADGGEGEDGVRARLGWRDLAWIAPFFLLSAGAGCMTIWFQNHKAIGGEMVQDLNLAGRVAAAAWAVWFYLWKGLVPVNICVIYPRWSPDPASVVSWLPMAGLIGVFIACWYFRKSWGRHGLLGLGYVVVTLFPVMGFFSMYFLVFSRVADHWQYLALAGTVATAVCGGVYGYRLLAERQDWPPAVGWVLAGLLLAFLSYSTWNRAEVYTTEKTLWSDTVKKNPQAWMAFNNLGNAYGHENRTAEAIAAYESAIRVNPGFPDAHSNLGNSLVSQGKLDEAIEHFKKAIAGEPRMANFHFNYGIALFDQGKNEEAVKEYQEALRLNPGSADVRNNLANVYIKQEKFKEALEQALIAIQIKPEAPEPQLNAAMALSSLGRTAEAARYFESAAKINPDGYALHHEYGMMLAMQGKLAEALPHFQALVRLKPDDAAAHSNLGNDLAGLKRLDEAIAEYRTALMLQPGDAQTLNNIANVMMEQGKVDEALENYAASVKSRPSDAETRMNYSYALVKKGKVAEAIAQCEEALRLRPGDAKILGQLRALTGK